MVLWLSCDRPIQLLIWHTQTVNSLKSRDLRLKDDWSFLIVRVYMVDSKGVGAIEVAFLHTQFTIRVPTKRANALRSGSLTCVIQEIIDNHCRSFVINSRKIAEDHNPCTILSFIKTGASFKTGVSLQITLHKGLVILFTYLQNLAPKKMMTKTATLPI